MRRSLQLVRLKSSFAADWSLNDAEVEALRIQYGTNHIVELHSNRWLELAIDTAKDPMIWFLLVTSLLFYFLNQYNQAIILFLATIPLIGMDAFLHWRTQASTQGLRGQLTSHAIVIRNGIEKTLPAWEIVPGDLIVLSSGMFFPADGILVAGKNLQVDESALTGEAYAVSKKIVGPLSAPDTEIILDNESWGFAGTRLLTGRALLRAVYTGQETLYGEIVNSALMTSQERTPLQKSIAKLVFILIFGATLFCIILAFARYYQGFGVIDSILSAATLAVAALPDEFPVVFTFFLGVGVYRLAKKKALVRRAVSVENIGRITYICSDKTGTITEGCFRLAKYFPAHSLNDDNLLSIAALASRKESGDPLDLAIHNEIDKKNITLPARLHTFPFTEERKRETVLIQHSATEYQVATKGAPETILALSSLNENEKQQWLDELQKLASSGYKVIACAQQIISMTTSIPDPQEHYQFSGLLAFEDPPRKGVFEAVKWCKENNIHVLMITGDHPETSRSIARQIGLGADNPNVVMAEEMIHLETCSDAYFRSIDVIARAVPSQKLNIVKALQSKNEIVAVTGDGVNDVPALKAADIGIAMGERGTQSAREIADIVLLDDNFDSIVKAIAEGRQLFKNLKLSYQYLLMIHIPFVFSAAIIPLLGFPLLYYPIHIVMIELIIHPTSMLVFQNLPQSKSIEPAIRREKIHFFNTDDWLRIIAIGLFSTLFIVLGFIYILHNEMSIEHARAFSLSFLGFMSAALTLGLSHFKTWTAKIVIVTTLIFSIVLIQIPMIATFLSFSPLSFFDWSVVIGASLIMLCILYL